MGLARKILASRSASVYNEPIFLENPTQEGTMGKEFELKYRATAPQLAAMEAAFSGFFPITMETTY